MVAAARASCAYGSAPRHGACECLVGEDKLVSQSRYYLISALGATELLDDALRAAAFFLSLLTFFTSMPSTCLHRLGQHGLGLTVACT